MHLANNDPFFMEINNQSPKSTKRGFLHNTIHLTNNDTLMFPDISGSMIYNSTFDVLEIVVVVFDGGFGDIRTEVQESDSLVFFNQSDDFICII